MAAAPRSTKRTFYYGWYVVFGLALVSAVMTGMGGINLGLFVTPMENDIGIGRSVFGLGQTARLLGFSLTGWFIGRYLDHHGARLALLIAGLVMGFSVIATGFVQAGWQFILLMMLSGMTGLQGAGANLYATVPISRWFLQKRGTALSVTFLGIPVGIFVLSPITQLLLDGVGWRQTWIILGIVGTAITVLIALLIIRRQPEDMGLLPDGAERTGGETQGGAHTRISAEYSWTREEAMRTATFWKLAFVDGLRMGALGTLGLFRVPYFIDNGVDAKVVAFALSVEAVVAAFVSLLAGRLVDRFPPRYVSAAFTLTMILTFILTVGADSAPRVFVAASLFGVGAQGFQVSQGTLWPNYFGAAHIGRIRGIALPLGLVFSAVSAPVTGFVRDETGSFVIAWVVAAVALALCTLLLLTASKPQPPVPVASASQSEESAMRDGADRDTEAG